MTIIKQIKSGLFHGFGFVLMLGISGIAYGAYVSLTDVNSGQTLTADTFNKVLENQRVLKTSVDTLSLASNPSGAVMAFDLQACPTGWTEYTALQGRFIRGADTGANNDPNFATRSGGTGTRKIGSIQTDELGSHSHTYTRSNGRLAAYAPGDGNPFYYDYISNTSNAGGSETRPKNVYLLYCRKN